VTPGMDIQKIGIFVISLVVLVGGGAAVVLRQDLPAAVQTAILTALAGVVAYWFSHSTNRPAD
jgi:hypothetical protein